jgi:hypothetical protein
VPPPCLTASSIARLMASVLIVCEGVAGPASACVCRSSAEGELGFSPMTDSVKPRLNQAAAAARVAPKVSRMTSMLKRRAVVVLLVLSLGTPWALLQSAAWLGMLVSYSRQASLVQAVSMTFDGKHPCRLCHLVKEGQAKEQREGKNSAKPDEQIQLGLPPVVGCLFRPPTPVLMAELFGLPDGRTDSPPTPPPRA